MESGDRLYQILLGDVLPRVGVRSRWPATAIRGIVSATSSGRSSAEQGTIEKAIRDKADFEWDYRIVHPEKGIRDIHTVGRAVLDGSGNLSEFVGTVIDVTERKRREQELRQSEVELRTITDTIRQPIGVLAPDGTQLYANRVALDNSGLTLDEVIKEGFFARL